uniref:FH2 domain-containing protein 1-like n=1 Tax=Pogona vitticeps TaxID=103695 RepID=A0ABM5FVH6_9SAUR
MVTVRSAPASPTDRTGPASPGALAPPGPARPSCSATASAAPSPPPPPPPPLPAAADTTGSPGRPPASAGDPGPPERRPGRLRNFNWDPIPAERIRGRSNLWTAAGRTDAFPLDVHLLEQLFGQRPEPPGGSLRGQPAEQVFLLDAKKILNLGIFLKQLKRPVQGIVADIQEGTGTPYGAEKLQELTKLLPDAEEVKRLKAFQGSQSRLSEAEVFALLLVRVPSYASRLELLVFKEEFFPRLSTLQSAIQILTEAALELLDCEELHDLIRLVLKAGNYLNQGGYAGSALGFRVPSLLRLADTKANRPGMDLLQFVALEAEKMDPNLLHFPSKLQHVGPASRIVDQEVTVELQSLAERLLGAQAGVRALGLEAQMEPFLQGAEAELGAARTAWEGLQHATATLADFLCEDLETFSLPGCCGVLLGFGERFVAAVQENRARAAAAQRRQQRQEEHEREKQKRRSIATCSSRDPGLQDVELDRLFFQPLARSGRRSRTHREPQAIAESPQARERPSPLSRRHTLPVLPAGPEPPALAPGPAEAPPSDLLQPPAPSSSSSSAGSRKKGAGGLLGGGGGGGGLRAWLRSPAPSPTSPEGPSGSRFSGLFSKKTLPEAPETPTSPQASPKDVSALVGFFRRLSLGEKPRSASQT